MKTVVYLETNESRFLEQDDAVIVLSEDKISINGLSVLDLNSENCAIYNAESAPEDWSGNKYFFIPDEIEPWQLKPEDWEYPKPEGWVDPVTLLDVAQVEEPAPE